MCHDAAFLIVADGHAILDCNDARLTAAQARRAKHLAGGRWTSWRCRHPARRGIRSATATPTTCVAQIESDKRIGKFRSVMRLVRATAPELAVPFAGPPCFLDHDLVRFNESLRETGIFPDAEQAEAGSPSTCRCSGGRASGRATPSTWRPARSPRIPISAAFSYTDGIDEYLASTPTIGARRSHLVHADAGEPGHDLARTVPCPLLHTRHAVAVLPDAHRHDGALRGDRAARRQLGRPDGPSRSDRRSRRHAPRAPEYTFTVEGRWLDAVLRGEIAWEDLLLSLRLTARRNPDQYNDYLIGLLKHANEPALQAIEDVRDQPQQRRTSRRADGGTVVRDRPLLPTRRRGSRRRCDRYERRAAVPRTQLRIRPADRVVPQRPSREPVHQAGVGDTA